MGSPAQPDVGSPGLIRGMGLGSATALNMIDMIGVGPFITMPLVLGAMGGPQARLGWIAGALLAVCDGLVSAELGSMFPGSAGSRKHRTQFRRHQTVAHREQCARNPPQPCLRP